jgi:hypothetical protein
MATRKSSSRKSNPSSKRKKNPSTGGTKKGGMRKTSRKAYEKNPPMMANPMLQAAIGGALAVGVDKVSTMLAPGLTGGIAGAAVKAVAGIALGNKKVFKGQYAAAGGAMIGIAAYQLVSGLAGGATGAVAAAPFGPPWVGSSPQTGGLAYDPMGAETLNYGNVVNQYA